jgi:regulator of sigma E protease
MHAILNVLQMIASRGLVLGVLVFIHEMGHYLAARWRGVHVEAFSIGFGPKLLSWTDKHETVWKLCVLPLGGFVKMHGMALNVGDEVEADREVIQHGRAFFEKSVLSRAIVVAAGPIANFLLAAVLFSGLYATLGRPVVVENPPAVIGQVGPGSSAADAGLQPGDTILAIDGTKIGAFEDMRRIVAASAGKTLALRVHRGTQDLTVTALIKPKTPGDMSVGQLGVAAGGTDQMERLALGPAIVAGVAHTGSVLWQILAGLGHLITTGQGVHELAGPIGVVMLSGQVAKLGAAAIVSFTAFLSINLGLVNLLPIPVLDGGHLMFYAAEAVRGRPLPSRALDYGYRLGFAFIASFFLFISWNDLVHTGAVRWVAHLIG